jgi:hypothetical protein
MAIIGGGVMAHGGTSAVVLSSFDRLAAGYDVPRADVLLIAINLFGVSSPFDRHRARLSVTLLELPGTAWQVIVPLNAPASPFWFDGEVLRVSGSVVAEVRRVDADEAVGGYFRDGGRAATLNPNARSRCVGCAFCPNTLEAAADPRLAEERGLAELLRALTEQHPQRDLTRLREVTVSTGCFEREDAAVQHLVALRRVLGDFGVGARIGFLTSVLRTADAFAVLAQQASPFTLRLTAECFTRRDLLLKASKAQLTREEMPEVLRMAREAGHEASFTYIVGLDDLEAMRAGLEALAPHVSAFPNFQVYQAHNQIMAGLRAPGAQDLEFYLAARRIIEEIYAPSGLRPAAWECYRPLWHYAFAGEQLVEAQ